MTTCQQKCCDFPRQYVYGHLINLNLTATSRDELKVNLEKAHQLEQSKEQQSLSITYLLLNANLNVFVNAKSNVFVVLTYCVVTELEVVGVTGWQHALRHCAITVNFHRPVSPPAGHQPN